MYKSDDLVYYRFLVGISYLMCGMGVATYMLGRDTCPLILSLLISWVGGYWMHKQEGVLLD